MPAGLGPSMPNDAISAARFSITVDGYEIAQFSELTGITTEVEVIDFMENGSSGANILKKLPGKRKPPTITLRRGKNTSMELWAWHESVVHGDIVGATQERIHRASRTATTAAPVCARHFHDGWPAKIAISPLKAGSSEVLMEEVTIVCERQVARAGGSVSLAARDVVAVRPELTTRVCLFVPPRGYVDRKGVVHRDGVMRLATARDEIGPQSDPRVRQNAAYMTVLLLERTVTRLGTLQRRWTCTSIEGLFASGPRVSAGPVPALVNQDGHTEAFGQLPCMSPRVHRRHRR